MSQRHKYHHARQYGPISPGDRFIDAFHDEEEANRECEAFASTLCVLGQQHEWGAYVRPIMTGTVKMYAVYVGRHERPVEFA